MVCRYMAGAAGLPFFPLRSYFESDLPKANPRIVPLASPYGDDEVYAVPPLHPDVTIVHAQRADAGGNAQIWGLLGCQKEAAFAAERVIVVCEEIVDERRHPARSQSHGHPRAIVDAVVVQPFALPSVLRPGVLRPRQPLLPRLGRDLPRRGEAEGMAATSGSTPSRVHDEYVEKLGADRWASLGRARLGPAR